MVIGDVVERSIDFAIVCVPFGVRVCERVIAGAVATVSSGGDDEESVCDLVLLYGCPQDEGTREECSGIGMVEVRSEAFFCRREVGKQDLKRVGECILDSFNSVMGGQNCSSRCLVDILDSCIVEIALQAGVLETLGPNYVGFLAGAAGDLSFDMDLARSSDRDVDITVGRNISRRGGVGVWLRGI